MLGVARDGRNDINANILNFKEVNSKDVEEPEDFPSTKMVLNVVLSKPRALIVFTHSCIVL